MSDFEKGAEAMRASAAREAMNSADVHLSGNENAICIEIADAIRALPLPVPPADESMEATKAAERHARELRHEQDRWIRAEEQNTRHRAMLIRLVQWIEGEGSIVPTRLVAEAKALAGPVTCEHCPEYPHPLNDDGAACERPVPASDRGTNRQSAPKGGG
jgi:hypothetical protein